MGSLAWWLVIVTLKGSGDEERSSGLLDVSSPDEICFVFSCLVVEFRRCLQVIVSCSLKQIFSMDQAHQNSIESNFFVIQITRVLCDS